VPNKDKSGYTDVTEWHNITLWRNLADVVDKYVRKGSQLYIEGKLRTREYDKNGVKCYSTEIVADELKLLGRRQEGAPQQGGYQQSAYQQPQQPQYQGGYQQQPQYQQPAYQQPQYQQPAPQPAAPAEAPIAANDSDDLPF
jgi:single-strand DNA-binding protein